jgi:hypothetical protein
MAASEDSNCSPHAQIAPLPGLLSDQAQGISAWVLHPSKEGGKICQNTAFKASNLALVA